MGFHLFSVLPARTKALLVCLVAAVGAAVIWAALRSDPPVLRDAHLEIMPEKIDLDIKEVLYREVGGKAGKWEIKAKRASYMKKINRALFEDPEMKVFLSDGRIIVMKGDRGDLNTATRDMTLTGHVSLVSQAHERFDTEYLEYSHGTSMVHTGAEVVMQAPSMQVRAVGMSLSLKEERVILLSKVRARLHGLGR